ncbi:MAG: hypothetical protein OXH36_05180, partial [Bdellovibrionales bacterium]|nr:hypothetical protein [Bdellovibrionales bacterium]
EQPSTCQYPSFEKMSELWDNLAKWSSEDKVSQWGEFYHDIYGKRFHVGIPYYQVILTIEDRNNLSEIFWKMGWDSDSNPTEEEIIKALKNNKNLLSKKTSNRIEKGKPDFLSVLIDRVLEELKEYNEEISVQEDRESEKRGFIDLCLEIDETAEQINISFRCRRKAGLPEEEFTLTSQNTEWKVPFSRSNISGKIKNFNINWEKDLSAKYGKYSFHYSGQKYKVFTRAKNVSAWISGQRYTHSKLFYLAVHKSLFDKVQQWGEKECNECQVLEYSGLPNNWHLFRVKGVNKDSIKKYIPALSIDQKPRIKFEGGIRLSQGNRFFSFVPPRVSITGGTEQISKLFYSTNNSTKYKASVSISQDENCFSLPKDIPCEEWIVISDKQSKQEEAQVKIKLFLTGNRLKKFSDYSEEPILNSFGEFKSNQLSNNLTKERYLQGADGFKMRSNENYQKLPDIGLNPRQKIYLIGEIPGQIIIWPRELLPNSWTPIWLIQFKTHKKAVAIWLGRDGLSYTKQLQKFSKVKKKLWKDIIWHKRKRIKSEINKRWKEFSDRAKHV